MRTLKDISLNKEGQYCILCFAPKVNRIFKDGLTYYHCGSCDKISERSLVIDNNIVWWLDKENAKYWHESVGVFVFDQENKALFFERTIYPFALTIPAGHLDTGENAETAIKRELWEEAGLKTNLIRLFSEENVIGDECRRGADNHKWHLYTIKIENIGKIKINDEGVNPVWLSLKVALQEKLTYPVRYFIEKYGDSLLR